jgi:hypothetical protein
MGRCGERSSRGKRAKRLEKVRKQYLGRKKKQRAFIRDKRGR